MAEPKKLAQEELDTALLYLPINEEKAVRNHIAALNAEISELVGVLRDWNK